MPPGTNKERSVFVFQSRKSLLLREAAHADNPGTTIIRGASPAPELATEVTVAERRHKARTVPI